MRALLQVALQRERMVTWVEHARGRSPGRNANERQIITRVALMVGLHTEYSWDRVEVADRAVKNRMGLSGLRCLAFSPAPETASRLNAKLVSPRWPWTGACCSGVAQRKEAGSAD